MAPLPLPLDVHIADLSLSSLELDSRSSSHLSTIKSLIERDEPSAITPFRVLNILTTRSQTTNTNPKPSLAVGGAVSPDAFNNKGIQALFALIGASFVLGSIWFFFWAKNGGFQWHRNDWDDYKSTVLRRKGPNGTTLSNATKSTRLGGGSVVGQGYSDRGGSSVGDTMTEASSEAPILKEKRKNKRKAKENSKREAENGREKAMREANEAHWEGGHDDDVRAYRHERVAKVGGLNRGSDALPYGTNYSQTDSSVNSPSHHPRPSNRHSSQTNSRQASPEKRDRNSRQNFSPTKDNGFTNAGFSEPRRPARYHSPSKNNNTPRENRMPGSYEFGEPMDFSGVQSHHTKSYHHPMPGLGGQGRTGGGFRRGRGDELDD